MRDASRRRGQVWMRSRRRVVAWQAATGTCSPKRLGRRCLLSRCRRERWCVSSVLQKRWELNSRTGRLLGPREFDGRVPVLVQELLLGGVVIAEEERVRVKVDNIMVLSGGWMSSGGRWAKSSRNSVLFEEGCQNPQRNYGFSEEGLLREGHRAQ